MTKLLFCSISAFVFSLCLSQATFAADETENTYENKAPSVGGSYVSEPQEAETVPYEETKSKLYETLITDAVSLHNFVQAIDSQLAQAENFRLTVLDKEIDKKRIEDFDKCEEKKLSQHFKNPKDLWALLKETAEEELQEQNSKTIEQAADVKGDVAAALALSDEDRLKVLQAEWINDGDATAEDNKKANKGINIKETFSERKSAKEQKEEYKSIAEQAKEFYEKSGYRKQANKYNNAGYTGEKESAFWRNFDDSSVEWNIGYAILNDFYPYQDDYCKNLKKDDTTIKPEERKKMDAACERKSKTTASLPLWEDQKYLYNRDVWLKKYNAIVDECHKQGVDLSKKEPTIDDKFKYDYYFYDKVKAAHNAYLTYVLGKKCKITGDLSKPPVRAPRPLPPANEDIMLVARSGKEVPSSSTTFPENENITVLTKNKAGSYGEVAFGVYPQNPQNPDPDKKGKFVKGTLWEAYKKDNFKKDKVYKLGEFRSYFDESLNLNNDGENQTGNRISQYFELKNTAELSQNMYQRYLEGRDDLATTLNGFVEKYNLQVPEDMNYLSTSDLNKLKEAVRDKERKLIAQAKADLGERAKQIKTMTSAELKEDKYLSFLYALEKDKDAIVTLTRESAASIEDALKQAKANKELYNAYSSSAIEIRNDMLRKKNHEFDRETCLTPDEKAKVLVDVNSVKIE